jgi:predicted nuclease of restriction endonuclease-like (RecB) superfamily
MDLIDQDLKTFTNEISQLIETSRAQAIRAVNTEATRLYWHVGLRINTQILCHQRAEYGQQVVVTLATQLTERYGKGWGKDQLRQCIHFASVFPEQEIVYALSTQLSWTHVRHIMYMDNALKREFYIEMSKLEGWSSRQLRDRIRSMLYERTAISKKPEETIRQDLAELKNNKQLSQDLVFRDPYLLNFLGLYNSYQEKDLESAIIAEMQQFIIEMGSDFAFIARQKRIEVDHQAYYIDLLFYHRRLKCLVAIDLKIGNFEAGHKGQMELYLSYLDRYERVEGENPPVGLILCTGKSDHHVELMKLDKSNIRIADYLTSFPAESLLKEKLKQALLLVQEREASHLIDKSDTNEQ